MSTCSADDPASGCWKIYGYNEDPLTRKNFPDTLSAPDSCFGLFADFQSGAAAGTLPQYSFLEPSWVSTGNNQHPNFDVSLGEKLPGHAATLRSADRQSAGPGSRRLSFLLTGRARRVEIRWDAELRPSGFGS